MLFLINCNFNELTNKSTNGLQESVTLEDTCE